MGKTTRFVLIAVALYCASAGMFLAWKTVETAANRISHKNSDIYDQHVTVQTLLAAASVGLVGPVGIFIFGEWLLIETAAFPASGKLAKPLW